MKKKDVFVSWCILCAFSLFMLHANCNERQPSGIIFYNYEQFFQ